MSNTKQLVQFETIYKQAYGWSITADGYLAALTSGDAGYEVTDKKLTNLIFEALVLGQGKNQKDKIRSALADLVEYCYDSLSRENLGESGENASISS